MLRIDLVAAACARVLAWVMVGTLVVLGAAILALLAAIIVLW